MNKELRALVFDECLTEQGLAALRVRFPKNEVVDMSVDTSFKAARKSRTERNKLVEAINRKRIDTSTEIKSEGDAIIDEINKIFDTVVVPFETEDERRKEEERKVKAAHEELLKRQRAEIEKFMDFVTSSEGEDSKNISSAIDAISNIECEIFHKDIIHEAFKQKEDVMSRLSSMLTQRLAYESAEIERKKAEELRQEDERKRLIENKLNDLKMIPVNFMGKSFKEISEQLESLSGWTPSEEMFCHLYAEAVEALSTVIQQLEQAKSGAEVIEKAAEDKKKAEAERLQQIANDRRDAEQNQQSEPADNVHVLGESKAECEGHEDGALASDSREPTEAEIITRFFAGFAEFNPQQAEAIAEVIMGDGVPGVCIEVTKEK